MPKKSRNQEIVLFFKDEGLVKHNLSSKISKETAKIEIAIINDCFKNLGIKFDLMMLSRSEFGNGLLPRLE